MKILVTGGNGFLGGNITNHLRKYINYKISIGVRHIDTSFLTKNDVELIELPWHSKAKLKKICSNFDILILCAGMNAQECKADPIKAIEFNCLATARLVSAAVELGLKKIIYFSTAHIYRAPLYGDIDEMTLPESLHPYATSKRAAEDVVLAAHRINQCQAICLRLSNVIGTPANTDVKCWSLFMNDICRQAVIKKEIQLTSSGTQRRNFVTISDLNNLVQHVIENNYSYMDRPIFNVGGSWAPSISEAAEYVSSIFLEMYGSKIKIIKKHPQIGDINFELNYISEKIKNNKFVFGNDYEDAIKNLISYCNNTF